MHRLSRFAFYWFCTIFSLTSVYAGFGTVTGVTTTGDEITLDNGTDQLVIRVCTERLFRVEYQPAGASVTPSIVTDPNLSWNSVGAAINTSSDPITLETPQMKVDIDRSTGAISAYDAQGALLFSNYDFDSDDIAFSHDTGIPFYGVRGGFRAWGDTRDYLMRNDTEDMRDIWGKTDVQQGDSGSPLAWTTNGFGILGDLTSFRYMQTAGTGLPGSESVYPNNGGFSFSIGSNDTRSGFIWYGIVGDPQTIMREASAVTGRPTMQPKWALGFSNGQWGWDTGGVPAGSNVQEKLIAVIDGYRTRNIPIDNFAIDFEWKNWGETDEGDFNWHPTNFPDAASGTLKTEMDNRGLKMTGILKPRIHVNTSQGTEATNNNYWYPGSTPYADYVSGKTVRNLNFPDPTVQSWYANKMWHNYDLGIVGWWHDEGDENLSNTYGIYYAKSLYDKQRAETTNRYTTICRNFWLGAQRYGYSFWSGDIPTSWDGMVRERSRMLATINAGNPRWGMDAGGFNGSPADELYARWVQFSSFVPVFRVHSKIGVKKRYPWLYPNAEGVVTDAIRLRYSLMPYIYSHERMLHETGISLVRPLLWQEPDNSALYEYRDAWYFGEHLLVAPVVTQGQTSKPIYLPAGETWIDWFRGDVYQGGQTIDYTVNATTWEDIPLFVRKGGIVFTQPVLNYIGETPITQVTADIFPDTESSTLPYYDDDEDTYAYESGNYFKQIFTTQGETGNVTVTISSVTGSYVPPLETYLLKLHAADLNIVRTNGADLPEHADLATLQNATGEGFAKSTDQFGQVTYVKVYAGVAQNIEALSTTDFAITTTTLPNGIILGNYSAPLSTINEQGTITWSLSSGTLPNGLSLSSAGVISGTVSSTATSGDYPFTVQAVDSAAPGNPVTQTLTLTVEPDSIPAINTTSPLFYGYTGNTVTRTLQATGGNGTLTWALASGTLPTGLTLTENGTSATLSGTPTTEGTYTFTLQVEDGDGDITPKTFNMTIYAAPTNNGVNYAYYEDTTWTALPDFDALTPDATGTSSNFNISVAQRADDFAIRFTGYIEVMTEGTYTFYTTSDDGSQLYINSQLIVDNDGLHGVVEESGTITLTPGRHPITVDYFEDAFGQELTVNYSGPNITKNPIPNSVLFLNDLPSGGGYPDWKTTNSITSDTADTDNDGLPNLIEYAMGLNPNSADSFQSSYLEANGSTYTFFFKRDSAATDISVQVQHYQSGSWTDYTAATPTDAGNGYYQLTGIPQSSTTVMMRLKVVY